MSLQRFADAPAPSTPSTPWTLLTSAIDASQTTMVVDDGTPFPTLAQFDILIEDEILLVTATGGTWTVTRGAYGTVAAAHAAGEGVYHVLTAAALNRVPRSMTTLGDMEYLGADGAPARLAAPANGQWVVQFASGIPSWATLDLSAYVTLNGVQTLTNKTLTTPVVGDFSNATHSHQDAAGGGTLNAAAIAAGTIGLARIAGLTVSQFASPNISQWTNNAGYLTTAVTSLAGTANQVTVSAAIGAVTVSIPNSAQLSVAKLTNLTSNGFVKTTGGDGTLSIDTTTYTTMAAVAALYAPLTSPTLTGPVTINEAVGGSGLTITGATQTSNFPALVVTQAWNNAAVAFNGMLMTITDSSSSSTSSTSSAYFKVVHAGSERFSVRAWNSTGHRPGLVFNNTSTILDEDGFGFSFGNGGNKARIYSAGYYAGANGVLGFSSTADAQNATDAYFSRDAANVLAQRNSTNAQTFRLYNTYTDSSNYERGFFQYSSNVLQIGHQGAGTGSDTRTIAFRSSSFDILTLNQNFATFGVNIDMGVGIAKSSKSSSAAALTTSNSASFSVEGGSSTSTSGFVMGFRYINTVAPTSTSTATVVPVYIAPTINYSNATPGAGSYEALKIAVTETALPTGTNYLIRASAGAAGTTDKFTVDNNGAIGANTASANNSVGLTVTSTAFNPVLANMAGTWTGNAFINVKGNNVIRFETGPPVRVSLLSLGITASLNGSADVFIERDAAATLALRNSTTAQTFRVYNTFTDSSNYERGFVSWVSNVYTIGTEVAGTGVARSTELAANGVVGLTVTTSSAGAPFVRFAKSFTSSSSSTSTAMAGPSGSATNTSGTVTLLSTGTFSMAPTATSTALFYGLNINPTINYSNATPGAGSYEALKIAVTETALPTGTNYLIRASAGSAGTTDKFYVLNDGTVASTKSGSGGGFQILVSGQPAVGITRNGTVGGLNLWANGSTGGVTGESADTLISSAGIVLPSGVALGWSSSAVTQPTDVLLRRDAAATLALRNSTTAQTFNIYNTYTDASNYERAGFKFASNNFRLSLEAAGTGNTARNIELQAGSGIGTYIQLGATSGIDMASRDLATVYYRFSNDTFNMRSTGIFKWSSTSTVTVSVDTGLARNAAGVLEVNNGTASTYRDLKLRAIEMVDGDLFLGTTTGTKIGTSTNQKLALWNATPNVQPTTAITGATFVANAGTAVNDASTFDGYTIGQMAAILRRLGAAA